MKIGLSFSELQSVLGYTNTVLSDKSVEDKMRNVIFMVNKDEVKVVGYNVFTFARTRLDNAVIEDVGDEGWEFQVKASDLNKIVASFSSLYKTEVKNIELELEGVRIKVTLHEEAKEEKDSHLAQDSTFYLESAPIMKNILTEIHKEYPDASDMVSAGDLLLYLDSLFSLLNNDASNSMTSKLNFAEDYAFVITGSLSAFMVNKLPDAFKGITITYSSTNFLKKLCENVENLGVAKEDKYLCIQSGNTEAFMRYSPIKINYKMYVSKYDTSNGIVLDRLYFKDVLKRMGSIAPDGKAKVTSDGGLHVSNNNFEQLIPLNKSKGEVGNISFNMAVGIMEKTILGLDSVMPEEMFMYFVSTARGYVIYTGDKTGSWFASTQVSGA